MIDLLIKQLLRSRGLIIGLLILFITGMLSIHVGKVFVDSQEQIIELTEESQKEHIQRHVEYDHDHIGLLLYYIKFGYANDQSSMAGLSIGQNDIRQAAQLVNIRNLEEQKNAYELMNPYFQLLGNLDFSFLLVYLFPLIIIALSFNLWSEEKESGRWPLLSVQSDRPNGIIASKLLLRFVVILAILFALLTIAILYLGLPFDSSLFIFASISVLYICFWFSLSWWVISLGKSSRSNAITLLIAWILLTTIIPATANSAVSYLYPIPEAYETTIDSRDGYHSKWDQPKEEAIDPFKEIYPEYAAFNHPEEASFSWFWYYAMQHMGDEEAQEARTAMKEKLHKRNELTKQIGYFIPSIHTQLSMNAICRTDMTNYLNYLEALESFHEDLRLSFYSEIFEATPIEDQNWDDYKLDFFTDSRDIKLLVLLPLFLINCLLLALTYSSYNRKANL
ncbi:MAG: DUF3526 domain-containing protein [Bacteroidota bacterium]